MFEFDIVGYEFPLSGMLDQFDSNWLRLQIRVVHPRGEWEVTDPCLLTWEVKELADWFAALAHGKLVDPSLEFTEPNVSFWIIQPPSRQPKLRVCFAIECAPPWADPDSAPSKDSWVEFPLSALELEVASESLHQALERYPQRIRAVA